MFYLIFAVIIFTILFPVILSLVEQANKKKINIKNLLEGSSNLKEERKSVSQHFNEIEKEEGKLKTFLKSILIKSNLKNPLINESSIIVMSVLFGIIVFLQSIKILTFLQGFIVGGFACTLPGTILYMYGEKIGDKTNEYFIDFLNLLLNFLEIKDDINFAMENATKPRYKIGILKQFAQEYTFDIKHGKTTEQALISFSKKIDNEQIKNLCKTLVNCSKTSGMYLLVVRRYTENYVELYDKLIERKTIAKKKRLEMFSLLGGGILVLLGTSLTKKGMFVSLQSSFIGQGLICLVLLSCIYLFFIAIYIGKFEFD